MSEFDRRGLRVVAISVDAPSVNHDHRQKVGLTFPLLSDEKAETIRRYDLLHARAAPDGSDIARPAEFLVDPTGTVRWINLTESFIVRARPEQALEAFDALDRAAPR